GGSFSRRAASVAPGKARRDGEATIRRPSPGVCPSGQRERAVNPSAQPTEVRILPPPLRREVRCGWTPQHDDFAAIVFSRLTVAADAGKAAIGGRWLGESLPAKTTIR